ncbi:MAG: hypothetical protein NZ773_12520 [Dehalococcoidia bacterium]|nr:hypothetical protein [Dehalococcoidia bacterium]
MSLSDWLRQVIEETVLLLFPGRPLPAGLVKRHVWRDQKYVGAAAGRVVPWEGWSANLANLDARYRAIFADVVDNILPESERYRLFGDAFSEEIRELNRFVVLFVLDFPLETEQDIILAGFTPRRMARVLHACKIVSVEEFLDKTTLHWAAVLTRLVMLQRFLSIHRKPLEGNELPLQHLLYQTGYLHKLIVSSGLELYSIDPPRRSGRFGHDLEILARNPVKSPEKIKIGVEAYLKSPGYHLDSIPQYIKRFSLDAIMVVAPDNPRPVLFPRLSSLGIPVYEAHRVAELGRPNFLGFYHLPLHQVIADLRGLSERIVEVIPALSFQKD